MRASRSLSSSFKLAFSLFKLSTSSDPDAPLAEVRGAGAEEALRAGVGAELAALGTTPPTSAMLGAGLTGAVCFGDSDRMIDNGAAAAPAADGMDSLACRV